MPKVYVHMRTCRTRGYNSYSGSARPTMSFRGLGLLIPANISDRSLCLHILVHGTPSLIPLDYNFRWWCVVDIKNIIV